ncbi:hypothetical protein AAVH_40636, partial [Aphelenchoides avenae]
MSEHGGLPPSAIQIISDISNYSLIVVSPLCYVFVVWIVYYKSPRAMGAYK